MQLEASEEIDRPAATVFDFIGFHHVANHPRWDPEVQLQQLTKGPIGVGTVIRRRSTHYGEAIDDVMECVEFDPPSAIGLLVAVAPWRFMRGCPSKLTGRTAACSRSEWTCPARIYRWILDCSKKPRNGSRT
jgi:hypothetical protein